MKQDPKVRNDLQSLANSRGNREEGVITMNSKTTDEHKKPEAKFIAGAISATVWKNPGTEGEYSTINLARSYKDRAGKWQTTTSFRINDLPKASLVLNKAYDYLMTHREQSDT